MQDFLEVLASSLTPPSEVTRGRSDERNPSVQAQEWESSPLRPLSERFQNCLGRFETCLNLLMQV